MTPELLKPDYADAMEDFHNARRRAVLGEVLSWVTGKTSQMIPYDVVRKRFGGLESANRQLKEIPLDAIVGTVSRYNDFNRKLLPLKGNDSVRWIGVRRAIEDMVGLPPIEVYKVGEAYFILDGHHRASVARELGSTHIQAYVREVYTRVPLSPDDQPDDIILKAEFADFLKATRLDELKPEADLRVTAAGEYDRLLEHISVHRYFQGIDEKRAIPYEEAVLHWYETIYTPIANIIRNRNILKDFPGRTEADLYLWIMEHQASIQEELGWKVSPGTAASDLASRYSPTLYNFLRRTFIRFFKFFTPDQFEPSPPPGAWRQRHDFQMESKKDGIFETVMVAVTGDEAGWPAVDEAIFIAKNENASLGGLHISPSRGNETALDDAIASAFHARCSQAGVEGALATEKGNITRVIYERSFWADLLVLRLSFPPPFFSFRRFGSGLRNLIRLCQTPMILVPPDAKIGIKKLLLAYGGGPKADEALYLSAYLASRWNAELFVVTVRRGTSTETELSECARAYLQEKNISRGVYILETGQPAAAILKHSQANHCDMIIMGGYEGGFICEMVFGSTVDRVLWETKCSVLISP